MKRARQPGAIAQRDLALLLTPRERDVVLALANGHTVPSAATVLGIARGTAKIHAEKAMRRIGVHCRADLVRFALRHKDQLTATVDTTPALPPALAALEAHDLATLIYAAEVRRAHPTAQVSAALRKVGPRVELKTWGAPVAYEAALQGAKSVSIFKSAAEWISDEDLWRVEAVRADDVLVTFTINAAEKELLGLAADGD